MSDEIRPRWKVIGTYRTCQLPYVPLTPLPKKLNRPLVKQAVQPCQEPSYSAQDSTKMRCATPPPKEDSA